MNFVSAMIILTVSIVFAQGPTAPVPTPASTQAPSFEPEYDEPPQRPIPSVSDIDFSHLQTTPQFSWGFNPFMRIPGYAEIDPENDVVNSESFELNAIIYDPEDPVAIINDKTVGVGDELLGIIIEEISASYVVMRGNGMKFELTLPPVKASGHSAEIKALPEKEKAR